MKINLNNPLEFTLDKLKELIASEDDSKRIQLRVSNDGFLFLSQDVGNKNLEGILFRFETFGIGNGYVGQEAANDNEWMNKLYNLIKKNWANPGEPYIDVY